MGGRGFLGLGKRVEWGGFALLNSGETNEGIHKGGIVMRQNGKWNDLPCSFAEYLICKK